MTEQGSTDPESTSDGAATEGASPAESEGEPTEDATARAQDAAESEAADAGEEALENAVDEALVERVADSDPETIAREIAELRVELEGLEGELASAEETVDELESKLARARADFKNYKQRTEDRAAEARERAKADLLADLLEVHDNLERALEQEEGADIRGGVESTLQQFDEVLAAEGVERIDPEPGESVDPHRHEVLVSVESDRPEGTIDDVHHVGYAMDDAIVREAQVTVSDGSGHDDESEDAESTESESTDADDSEDGDE